MVTGVKTGGSSALNYNMKMMCAVSVQGTCFWTKTRLTTTNGRSRSLGKTPSRSLFVRTISSGEDST